MHDTAFPLAHADAARPWAAGQSLVFCASADRLTPAPAALPEQRAVLRACFAWRAEKSA